MLFIKFNIDKKNGFSDYRYYIIQTYLFGNLSIVNLFCDSIFQIFSAIGAIFAATDSVCTLQVWNNMCLFPQRCSNQGVNA